MFDIDFVALLPELLLLSTTIVLCCYGLFLQRPIAYSQVGLGSESESSLVLSDSKFFSLRNPASILLSPSKIVIFVAILAYFFQPFNGGLLCNGALIIDNFTFYFKICLLGSILTLFFMAEDYFKESGAGGSAGESIILILLSTASMLFLISAFDFLTIYLAIELQSLSFYILGASLRNSEYSTEAGLKYFILGAFSSGILLLGFSIIYGYTGATNFEQLWKMRPNELSPSDPIDFNNIGLAMSIELGPVFVGFLLISIGFLFKLTAAPFHLWAADVYEGSPIYVTALFSMAPKIALLAIMLRLFVYTLLPTGSASLSLENLGSTLILCSMASMIVGAFAALSQNKIKRLLTFSGIGHVGFFLMGLSCSTIDGCAGVFVGLFIYLIMTISMFTIIHSLRPSQVQYIQDLGSLETTGPLFALTLAITMFSYAGIPPLAGFCSKLYLIFAAISSGSTLLAFVAILTSVISCFYYIRLVRIMYFGPQIRTTGQSSASWPVVVSSKNMSRSASLLLASSTLLLIFFFLYPSPLFAIGHNIACSLCL